MSVAAYFVRSRGRVTGPYSVDHLHRLIARNSVSRFDQISSDRANWTAAGDVEELFGDASTEAEANPEPPASAPAATASSTRFYYSQNGVEVGPVDVNVLRSIASSGALKSNDMVWSEGAPAAAYAFKMPFLASFFSSGRGHGAHRNHSAHAAGDRNAESVLKAAGPGLMAMAIICGAILLVSLIAPVVIANGNVWWWWSAGGTVPGAIAVLTILLLVAIASIVCAAAIRGMARGISLLSVSGIALATIMVSALANCTNFEGIVAATSLLLAPAAAVLLIGVCRVRRCLPDADTGPLPMVLGIVAVACGVGVIATMVVAMSRGSALPLPAWVVTFAILALLEGLSIVAAGVLSIVSYSVNSTELAGVSLLLARLGIGFAAASAACILGGVMGYTGAFDFPLPQHSGPADFDAIRGWLIFVALRVLAIFACLYALLGGAMFDLLLTLEAMRARRAI